MNKIILLTTALLISLLLFASASAQEVTVNLWAGGEFVEDVWHDTIYAYPDDWIDIPIYCQTGEDVYVAVITYPLGARYDLVNSFDSLGSNWDYWPFNTGHWGSWHISAFADYNDDQDHGYPAGPNPPGYHSLAFIGFARGIGHYDTDYLHSEIPIHILDFRVHISDNDSLSGYTFCNALIEGTDRLIGHAVCGDTLGGPDYPVNTFFACINILPRQQYFLGDANMYLGGWPPMAIGGDVTYLVNYFRSIPSSQPCPIDGFWASADVNGDCVVIGSDVTRLVNYFKGNVDLDYCPDYPSMWPTPVDIPEQAPEGWPNCE